MYGQTLLYEQIEALRKQVRNFSNQLQELYDNSILASLERVEEHIPKEAPLEELVETAA